MFCGDFVFSSFILLLTWRSVKHSMHISWCSSRQRFKSVSVFQVYKYCVLHRWIRTPWRQCSDGSNNGEHLPAGWDNMQLYLVYFYYFLFCYGIYCKPQNLTKNTIAFDCFSCLNRYIWIFYQPTQLQNNNEINNKLISMVLLSLFWTTGPFKRFPVSTVTEILKDVLTSYLQEEKYEVEWSQKMTKTICEVNKLHLCSVLWIIQFSECHSFELPMARWSKPVWRTSWFPDIRLSSWSTSASSLGKAYKSAVAVCGMLLMTPLHLTPSRTALCLVWQLFTLFILNEPCRHWMDSDKNMTQDNHTFLLFILECIKWLNSDLSPSIHVFACLFLLV